MKLSFRIFILCLLMSSVNFLDAQQVNKQVFKVVNPDFKNSPITGMTRQHWKDAALYMLKGAFGYIHNIDDPMKFPKMHEVSYPKTESQVPTEKLEGLSRTLFVAAPLLHEDSNLVLNGIRVADYYRHQISNLVKKGHPSFIKQRGPNGGASQILVEFGALSISLFSAPKVLWDPLPQNVKDSLAATMLSYGDGPTVSSNWRFFNVFILSFFDQHGYKANKPLMVEYLNKSLDQYRGEGWYNDSPAFDYYSMWAFQMYGALWANFYGNENYPEIADKFISNFKDLDGNYPNMFSREGKMIMYGRSISYRYASATVFPLMGLIRDFNPNWGWMRMIASSTILQFFENPDFMQDGVPTLGFYGPFEPATQMYSCRGSVYWGGKIFLGLLIPENSPFWQAAENRGPWETIMKTGQVYNTFEKGSNLLITDYPNIGASEVRAWCHADKKSDWQKFRSTENYNRLSYNSQFLWQADGKNGETAMAYVVNKDSNEWEPLRLYTFKSYTDGFYRRDAVLESDSKVKFNLSEKTLPDGILRIDTVTSANKDIQIHFGHYALPELGKPIENKVIKIGKFKATVIDNGKYQLALILLNNWGKSAVVNTKGLNPEADQSSVINVSCQVKANTSKVMKTLLLWKKSGENWKNFDFSGIK